MPHFLLRSMWLWDVGSLTGPEELQEEVEVKTLLMSDLT